MFIVNVNEADGEKRRPHKGQRRRFNRTLRRLGRPLRALFSLIVQNQNNKRQASTIDTGNDRSKRIDLR